MPALTLDVDAVTVTVEPLVFPISVPDAVAAKVLTSGAALVVNVLLFMVRPVELQPETEIAFNVTDVALVVGVTVVNVPEPGDPEVNETLEAVLVEPELLNL